MPVCITVSAHTHSNISHAYDGTRVRITPIQHWNGNMNIYPMTFRTSTMEEQHTGQTTISSPHVPQTHLWPHGRIACVLVASKHIKQARTPILHSFALSVSIKRRSAMTSFSALAKQAAT
mmetsp:Transcript_135137/g.234976  ORF Transcript_135137/g.234976 Transcript_135137/m.234976 type:complete len:120 (-) Transcript_135137:1185-1544(-)